MRNSGRNLVNVLPPIRCNVAHVSNLPPYVRNTPVSSDQIVADLATPEFARLLRRFPTALIGAATDNHVATSYKLMLVYFNGSQVKVFCTGSGRKDRQLLRKAALRQCCLATDHVDFTSSQVKYRLQVPPKLGKPKEYFAHWTFRVLEALHRQVVSPRRRLERWACRCNSQHRFSSNHTTFCYQRH